MLWLAIRQTADAGWEASMCRRRCLCLRYKRGSDKIPFELRILYPLPEPARYDLIKAATRLRDGDLSGALAAACGTVESACAKVHAEGGHGSPAGTQSFQEKVKKSLEIRGAFQTLESELIEIGWDSVEARLLVRNLQGSLNQAAYVMQTLRSRMSDVHGSKPTLEAVVFDSLKWATIIASLLK